MTKEVFGLTRRQALLYGAAAVAGITLAGGGVICVDIKKQKLQESRRNLLTQLDKTYPNRENDFKEYVIYNKAVVQEITPLNEEIASAKLSEGGIGVLSIVAGGWITVLAMADARLNKVKSRVGW